MLFNSLHFLFFFPIVFLIYYLIPNKYRWILLLTASYYFYMSWKPEYVVLLLLSTTIDYLAALYMAKTDDLKKRKKLLYMSLTGNLGMLFFFKYFNFFNQNINLILHNINKDMGIPELNILLPLGISFYTFQSLSYTIDVYRGEREPEKHFGIFALYVSFFPQLVAGPIERSTHLLPQFKKKISFKYSNVVDGAKTAAWGFFKKIVIADRLGIIVEQVYNRPHEFTGYFLIVPTILFYFQLYCDFSAYSDIAIGIARMMGFDLIKNFDRPFFSKSVSEFWRRWHISLSSWLYDYLYTPLAINFRYFGKIGIGLAVLITFLLSGLWHGASWKFVIMGLFHAIYIISAYIFKRYGIWEKLHLKQISQKLPKISSVFNILTTFILCSYSFIFFRASSTSEAIYIAKNIFVNLGLSVNAKNSMRFQLNRLGDSMKVYDIKYYSLYLSIAFILLLIIVEYIGADKIKAFLKRFPIFFRFIIYYIFFMIIVLFGVFEGSRFIYFQF